MSTIVFFNGQLVPSERAMVSVFDRGFLYGDGLFETLRLANGRPFQWKEHWSRFCSGLDYLRLTCPWSESCLLGKVSELVAVNAIAEGVLRLAISRGVGLRGYSPRGADRPTLVMAVSAFPESSAARSRTWRLATVDLRLPAASRLSESKSANKLLQVLARAEAEAKGAEEALLLDGQGNAIEAASANLFWIRCGSLFTPPLSAGALPGIARATILRLAQNLRISTQEALGPAKELYDAEGVFLTMSTYGVVEATELNRRALPRSGVSEILRCAYETEVQRETAMEGAHL